MFNEPQKVHTILDRSGCKVLPGFMKNVFKLYSPIIGGQKQIPGNLPRDSVHGKVNEERKEMRGTRERRDERKGRGSSTEGKTNTKAQRQQRGQESEKCRDTARKTKKLSAAGSDSSCGLQCREVSTGPPAALKIRQAYTCTSDGQTDDMCPHTHTQCGQSAAPWPRALHALSRVAPLWPPCPSKAVSAGHISAFSEKRGPHGVTLPDSHFRRLVSNNDLSCIIK